MVEAEADIESPVETESSMALEAEVDDAPEIHTPCSCGCARCREAMASSEEFEEEPLEYEDAEDAEDDGDIDDDAAPLDWEDIREELEAVDGSD